MNLNIDAAQIALHLLNFVLLILGFGIAIGIPFLFVYFIYRLIRNLMDHNAELKRRNRRDDGRD